LSRIVEKGTEICGIQIVVAKFHDADGRVLLDGLKEWRVPFFKRVLAVHQRKVYQVGTRRKHPKKINSPFCIVDKTFLDESII